MWSLELVDASNASGTLEFVCGAADPKSFFPVEIAFTAKSTLRGVALDGVVTADSEEPVKYGSATTLTTAEYFVE